MSDAPAIQRGDLVKASRDGQRMWWVVEQVTPHGVEARLDNKPFEHAPKPCSFKRGDFELIRLDEILDWLPNP